MTTSPALAQRTQLRVVEESLSAKEMLYVQSRVNGTPPTASARIAGFRSPEEKSLQLEKDDRIRMATEVYVREGLRKIHITRDDVLRGLLEAIQLATTATEIIKAWSEISNIIGAKAPKQLNISHNDPEKLRQMDDAQLLELAGGDVIDGEYELIDFDEEDA